MLSADSPACHRSWPGSAGGLTGGSHLAGVSDRNQIAYEDEGLAWRDHVPGALVTVG
jgi:hypothetical protein